VELASFAAGGVCGFRMATGRLLARQSSKSLAGAPMRREVGPSTQPPSSRRWTGGAGDAAFAVVEEADEQFGGAASDLFLELVDAGAVRFTQCIFAAFGSGSWEAPRG
jgi:hypothetical protein